jgi:hypothetical protein
MSNPQEIKQAILAALAEKGEYATILKHLDTEQKEEKSNKMHKLIEPISAFADMLTENSKGAFMEELTSRLDATTKENLDKLTSEVAGLRVELQQATTDLLSSSKSDLIQDNLAKFKATEDALTSKLMQVAVDVVSQKASELLPSLSQSARLTDAEIDEIIEASALSVESQMADIVGDYIAEQRLSVAQIDGFSEAVRKLLPEQRQIAWGEILGKPDIPQGGTSVILVKRMIEEALAGFSGGGSLPNGGTTGQVLKKLSDADGDADWQDETGGGGGGVTDHGALTGLADDDHTQYHNDARGDARYYTKSQVDTSLAAKADTSSLSAVATSGDYNDLSNKPDLTVFDEIEQYANLAAFPGTGNAAKFYLAQDTGLLYRWTGSAYAVISAELALGETSSTAYRGDRGKTAYDHSQLTTGNPHNVTKADVGLGSVDNVSAASLRDRSTHTGTQPASTISDFATAVAATAAVTANTAKVTNATHTGDVTGATALTIANDVVTNAKLANVATATIKGRTSAGTGDPEDLNASQVKAILDYQASEVEFDNSSTTIIGGETAVQGAIEALDFAVATNTEDLNNAVIDLGTVTSKVDTVIEDYLDLDSFPGTGNSTAFFRALDTGIIYAWNGTSYDPIGTSSGSGGGSSDATIKSVTQSAHGFSVGNVLKKTGASYALAQANTAANAEVVGIVSAVADANTFTLLTGGYISTLSSLTANTTYFLSDATAGLLTTTEPTAVGSISKPLLNSVSTTAGVFTNMRGMAVTGASADFSVGAIVHGSTASTARPSGYVTVIWTGSVEPTNATDNDIWNETA